MKKEFHQVVFSPSELVSYVQSPLASWLLLLCPEQPETKLLKVQPAAIINYLASKCLAHESDYSASLEQSTSKLVIILDRLNNIDKVNATLAASCERSSLIFQVSLTDYSDKHSAHQFQKDALLNHQSTASNHNNTSDEFDIVKNIHGWLLTKLSLRFVLAHQVFRVTVQDVTVPI